MTASRASALSATDWRFLAAHRVARLATVDSQGRPHLVPVCFAVDGAAIFLPLDEKPKRVAPTELRRVRNLLERPDVALLVDDYHEEWEKLAYLMVRGRASLIEPEAAGHAEAVRLLRDKYPQYQRMAIDRQPVIKIVPTGSRRWSWRDSGSAVSD